MAEEKPADEKTEAATPRRKERAREEGDRLQSRELATAMGGIAGALWMWAFGGRLASGMRQSVGQALSLGQGDIPAFQPVPAFLIILMPVAMPMLALAAMVLGAVIIGQMLSGGISFNPSKWAPKASRMDPMKGFRRIFGLKGVIELLKALMKAIVLIGLSAWLLWSEAPVLMRMSAMPLDAAIPLAGDMGMRLFLALSLGLALIAGVDLPVQILDWLKRLRMTKQDVKDEMKQQEGSPEMKWAMRRMARDNLKRASRVAMADATVVLTNPTHFAVALRYRPETDAAPIIVARGRGLVAEVIRELASERQVLTLSYPSVARALYFTGRVGMMIRADLYAAVATILAYALRGGAQAEPPPPVEAPETAQFDSDGKRIIATGSN